MLVFFFIFVILLRGVEEEIGETDYFLVYFVGVLLGNLGLLTLKAGGAGLLPTTGAMGGLFALAGVFIAKHPYELFTYDLLYPLPAILCVVAIAFIDMMTPAMRFDYLPLFFGVAAGFFIQRKAAVAGAGYYRRY
jgi:membrane associated rhomboid family serine protease